MTSLYAEAMAALDALQDDYMCEDDRRVMAEAKRVLWKAKRKVEQAESDMYHNLKSRQGKLTCVVTEHGKLILGKMSEVNGTYVGFGDVEIPTRYKGGSVTIPIGTIKEIREERT